MSGEQDPACWAWPLPTESFGDPWTDLAEWQDGRCAVCGRSQGRSPRLDHDHQTGLTRGWTCHRCNHLEGGDAGAHSVSARWRACPATAVLDLLLPYAYSRDGLHGDIRVWTGKTYLPASAPSPGRWPHALSCDRPPQHSPVWPGLVYPCGHDHLHRIGTAVSTPMSDGQRLLIDTPEQGVPVPEPGARALAALGDALTRKDDE